MNTYLIEGLDRLGKSTLIDGIKQKLGFYQVIHYAKPERLDAYVQMGVPPEYRDSDPLMLYQHDSFMTMFAMVKSSWAHGGKFIMDRAHLGEMVYAPLYRKYNGDYVLELERMYSMHQCHHAKLILLTEDFEKSKHFNDDGQSLGPASARAKEQEMFISAFERSNFLHKQIICVTAEDGSFRPKEDILSEALA